MELYAQSVSLKGMYVQFVSFKRNRGCRKYLVSNKQKRKGYSLNGTFMPNLSNKVSFYNFFFVIYLFYFLWA